MTADGGPPQPLQATLDDSVPPELAKIVQKAASSWLTNAEIQFLLQRIEGSGLPIHTQPPVKPTGGSLFLFNKRVTRFFRQDGLVWQCKRDGRTVDETHETLKVEGERVLTCYYASSAKDDLNRRSYWLATIPEGAEQYVLVHYLNDKSKKKKKSEANAKKAAAAAAAADSGAGSSKKPAGTTAAAAPKRTPKAAKQESEQEESEAESEEESEEEVILPRRPSGTRRPRGSQEQADGAGMQSPRQLPGKQPPQQPVSPVQAAGVAGQVPAGTSIARQGSGGLGRLRTWVTENRPVTEAGQASSNLPTIPTVPLASALAPANGAALPSLAEQAALHAARMDQLMHEGMGMQQAAGATRAAALHSQPQPGTLFLSQRLVQEAEQQQAALVTGVSLPGPHRLNSIKSLSMRDSLSSLDDPLGQPGRMPSDLTLPGSSGTSMGASSGSEGQLCMSPDARGPRLLRRNSSAKHHLPPIFDGIQGVGGLLGEQLDTDIRSLPSVPSLPPELAALLESPSGLDMEVGPLFISPQRHPVQAPMMHQQQQHPYYQHQHQLAQQQQHQQLPPTAFAGVPASNAAVWYPAHAAAAQAQLLPVIEASSSTLTLEGSSRSSLERQSGSLSGELVPLAAAMAAASGSGGTSGSLQMTFNSGEVQAPAARAHSNHQPLFHRPSPSLAGTSAGVGAGAAPQQPVVGPAGVNAGSRRASAQEERKDAAVQAGQGARCDKLDRLRRFRTEALEEEAAQLQAVALQPPHQEEEVEMIQEAPSAGYWRLQSLLVSRGLGSSGGRSRADAVAAAAAAAVAEVDAQAAAPAAQRAETDMDERATRQLLKLMSIG